MEILHQAMDSSWKPHYVSNIISDVRESQLQPISSIKIYSLTIFFKYDNVIFACGFWAIVTRNSSKAHHISTTASVKNDRVRNTWLILIKCPSSNNRKMLSSISQQLNLKILQQTCLTGIFCETEMETTNWRACTACCKNYELLT